MRKVLDRKLREKDKGKMKQKLNSVDLASWAIFTERYKDNKFLDVVKKTDLQVFYFLQEYKKEKKKGK